MELLLKESFEPLSYCSVANYGRSSRQSQVLKNARRTDCTDAPARSIECGRDAIGADGAPILGTGKTPPIRMVPRMTIHEPGAYSGTDVLEVMTEARNYNRYLNA